MKPIVLDIMNKLQLYLMPCENNSWYIGEISEIGKDVCPNGCVGSTPEEAIGKYISQ